VAATAFPVRPRAIEAALQPAAKPAKQWRLARCSLALQTVARALVTPAQLRTQPAPVVRPAWAARPVEAEWLLGPFRWEAAASDPKKVQAFRGRDELPAEPVAPVLRDCD